MGNASDGKADGTQRGTANGKGARPDQRPGLASSSTGTHSSTWKPWSEGSE